MTGFLAMTRKTVSTSSGILLKMKSMTHRPTAPWPKAVSAGAHTEAQPPLRQATQVGDVELLQIKSGRGFGGLFGHDILP